MYRKLAILMVVFVGMVSMAMAAGEQPSAVAKEIKIGEESNGKTVSVTKGQTLVISLAENSGSSGYRWSIEDFKPSILEQLDSQYQGTQGHGTLGGTRLFGFVARRAGESRILLHLTRPWSETAKPAQIFQVKVVVKAVEPKEQPAPLLSTADAQAGRSGAEMKVGTLNELSTALASLSGEELKAHSAIEIRNMCGMKEFGPFILIKDDAQKPRCPTQLLPLNNGALKTMVDALLKAYGKKAGKLQLAFLVGGMPNPGFTQVTLVGTGLGLYFNIETGKPMGKLTGKI